MSHGLPAVARTFPIRRAGVWAPPAIALAFTALIALAAPELETQLFFVFTSAAAALWLIRAWRVRVEVNDDAVTVHGAFRRRRLRLDGLRDVSVVPMRTASPLQGMFPYVALAVTRDDGSTTQFEEVSAARSRREPIDGIADAIRARLGDGLRAE